MQLKVRCCWEGVGNGEFVSSTRHPVPDSALEPRLLTLGSSDLACTAKTCPGTSRSLKKP